MYLGIKMKMVHLQAYPIISKAKSLFLKVLTPDNLVNGLGRRNHWRGLNQVHSKNIE